MLIRTILTSMPDFMKKKKLEELFRLTAEAFRKELPELAGLSYGECLYKYALYTREQAECCLQDGYSVEAVKSRLYNGSYIFGQKLRKSLHINTWEQAVEALEAIYKSIGIQFRSDGQGEFTINECFFSRHYSQEVCRLVSSLDEGLAAGLSAGGRLCFKQRLTEGACCCKGCFVRGN